LLLILIVTDFGVDNVGDIANADTPANETDIDVFAFAVQVHIEFENFENVENVQISLISSNWLSSFLW
jgi:hypothetical protein